MADPFIGADNSDSSVFFSRSPAKLSAKIGLRNAIVISEASGKEAAIPW
jgi:hypothetical protein